MKDRAIVILTAVVVVVVSGGVLLFVPSMQSSQRKLDERVGEAAERARRTVAQFNAHADATAALVDRAGLTAELTAENIESIIDKDHRPAQEALAVEQERLQQLQRSAVARMRQRDETFTQLDANAQLNPSSVPTFSDNPEGMKRDLTQGVQAREKLLANNRSRVDQALTEVTAALQDQEGDVSGRSSPLANRLSGITLMQEASAAARVATMRRQEAATHLYELAQAVRAYADAASRTGAVQGSAIDATIANRETALTEARVALADSQAQVDKLQARIAELQQGIAEQSQIAEQARTQMEALAARGLDYGAPDAAAKFTADYDAAARTYRAAQRAQHELEHGGLVNARIDETGDLLTGGFVAATPGGTVESVAGLVDVQNDLSVAQGDLDGRATQVRIAEAQLAAAKDMRVGLQEGEELAATQMTALTEQIAAAYATYQQSGQAAQTAEDLAVRKYRDAASAFNGAQAAQTTLVQGVPAELSPDAKERSPYKFIEGDAWLGGEAKSEAADAQMAAALVCHARVSRLQRELATLDAVNALVPLKDYDRAALEQRIAEATDQGLGLAEGATKALESAARDLGNHWTVAASAAAANYVMSLFGRPELRNLAMQNYNEVVKGREDNPNIRPFRLRLEQLHKSAELAADEEAAPGSVGPADGAAPAEGTAPTEAPAP